MDKPFGTDGSSVCRFVHKHERLECFAPASLAQMTVLTEQEAVQLQMQAASARLAFSVPPE